MDTLESVDILDEEDLELGGTRAGTPLDKGGPTMVHRVEIGRGTATCKGACRKRIPKGDVRFSKAGLYGGGMFFCVHCVTKRVLQNGVRQAGGSFDAIPGVAEILASGNASSIASVDVLRRTCSGLSSASPKVQESQKLADPIIVD